jgi:ferredoxin
MPHISAMKPRPARQRVGCEKRSRPTIYADNQGDDDIVDTATAPAKRSGFTVELARSGLEFFIPEGETILQVLLDEGVDVDFSCELGICGACEQRVISGIPEHRDSILSEEEQAENKRVMICCAGCKTERLVLDL